MRLRCHAAVVFFAGLLAAVAGAQIQGNSPGATLTLDGQSGPAVGIAVRSTLTAMIAGTPNARFIVYLGTPLASGIPTPAGFINVVPQAITLDGSVDPAVNLGPAGIVSFQVEIPAITAVGTGFAIQALMEEPGAPLGIRFTAPSFVTWQANPANAADHLFFVPTLGSKGVDVILPAAGTQPGDLPEFDRLGLVGATSVFDPANGQPVFTPFTSPFLCTTCHLGPQNVWNSYQGTMMANASRDPVFRGAFSVACADMDFLNANGFTHLDREAVADLCIRCHLPTAWYGGRSGLAGDGTTTHFHPDAFDEDLALDQEGIVCGMCHRATDAVPAISPGAFADPTRPENGQLVLSHTNSKHGPFPGTVATTYTAGTTAYGALQPGHFETAQPNVAHIPTVQVGTAVSPFHPTEQNPFITDAKLCGSCHNVTNPLTGVAEQRTYTEWADSDFGDPTDPSFRTCTQCHMPASGGFQVACDLLGSDPVYGAFSKIRQNLPRHRIVGSNAWVPQVFKILEPNVNQPWQSGATNYTGLGFPAVPAGRNALWDATTAEVSTLMATAAEVNLTAVESTPGVVDATVSIENLSGHKLPTGYPEGRRMWIQLRVRDANGMQVFGTGLVDLDNELILDPAVKVYEMLQGAEYPPIGIPLQETFHFILNNRIIKDNRIHPRGFVQRKGLGGTDSYDPVVAPYPVGGLYPDGHSIDTTAYSVVIPAGTPRPLTVTATVLHQAQSLEYMDFLANGGDAISSTMPAPEAIAARNLWTSGMPAPTIGVGFIGAASTPDPTAVTPTARVVIP